MNSHVSTRFEFGRTRLIVGREQEEDTPRESVVPCEFVRIEPPGLGTSTFAVAPERSVGREAPGVAPGSSSDVVGREK
jgi:hypothetical protein